MFRGHGLLVVALGASALATAAGERAPALVTYTLEEKLSSTTPNGERVSALAARVTVAGGKARMELGGAPLPRFRGSLVLLDGRSAVIVDPAEREGARLEETAVETLFSAPAGDEGGGAGVRLRDKKVGVTKEGAGAPFDGMPTARYRVLVNAFVNVTTPGRVATIHDVTKGVIETADLPEAASALDGLGRLFRVRGELREALDEELAKVDGFPVRVTIESEREMTAEAVGSAAPHDALERPMRTTVRAERAVKELSRRAFLPRDRALFAVPDDVRLRAPERLERGGASAR